MMTKRVLAKKKNHIFLNQVLDASLALEWNLIQKISRVSAHYGGGYPVINWRKTKGKYLDQARFIHFYRF
uniref:Uncharacterized protein n=1 Tax=Tanacetum cinerariifolium TaxID=118510 RepID=A0A6L2JQN1_TANCI|nr:hypothetical protein [Tanacetum cinerariifolium]GEX76471.1 hypothetical protein [Tanacetum cinerariifolium]